jgi:hypothetical protein
LYPVLAYELLQRDGALSNKDAQISENEVTVMTDADAPLPFVEAVVGDRALLSREKRPLKRMKAQIQEESLLRKKLSIENPALAGQWDYESVEGFAPDI